jgi:hypothetical protein
MSKGEINDQAEAFEERAAIMEYDGGLSRERAEAFERPNTLYTAGCANALSGPTVRKRRINSLPRITWAVFGQIAYSA